MTSTTLLIVLNVGWDFKEGARLSFNSLHYSRSSAYVEIQKLLNNEQNTYNLAEVLEVAPEISYYKSKEVFKLHNDEFYRDSLILNCLFEDRTPLIISKESTNELEN